MSDQMFVVEDEPDKSIPDGTMVTAVLDSVKKEHVEYSKNGEDKSFDKLVWWWKVISPEKFFDRSIRDECNAKFSNHPANRARQIAEALLNRELATGTGISLSDLPGLQADLLITREQDRRDPKKTWERISEILPHTADYDSEPPF